LPHVAALQSAERASLLVLPFLLALLAAVSGETANRGVASNAAGFIANLRALCGVAHLHENRIKRLNAEKQSDSE
jgi:hypothetical protein